MNLNDLSRKLKMCPYPGALEHVDRGIKGWGFYPAARGHSEHNSPIGGIMLLGRDWGTRKQYDQWVGSPARDETATTSRNVREFYENKLSPIPLWCGNYLPGIRKQGSAVGNLQKMLMATGEWSTFETFAWEFLQHQVLAQRPKVIVIFGKANFANLKSLNRLGGFKDEFETRTFSAEGLTHSALVTFADHPHSLISHASKARARDKVQNIAEIFESLT